MKMKFCSKVTALVFTLMFVVNTSNSIFAQSNTPKMKLLVHVTVGPENPTKAALAFLVARTAIEEGNTVTLFLAGDAVQLIRDNVLENLNGLGTGKLKEHFDILVKNGAKIYLSGNSSKARGITDADINAKPISFALPTVLVNLIKENDKNITY
ncbi:MAG: DsrE family protein [Sphingobacteriia bacterium]|jgi:predicted peroxiredoxin